MAGPCASVEDIPSTSLWPGEKINVKCSESNDINFSILPEVFAGIKFGGWAENPHWKILADLVYSSVQDCHTYN